MCAKLHEVHLSEGVCRRGGMITPFISIHMLEVDGARLEDVRDDAERIDYQYAPHEEDDTYAIIEIACSTGLHREGDYMVPDGLQLALHGLIPTRDAEWFDERVCAHGHWWFLVRFEYDPYVLYFTVGANGVIIDHEIVPVEDVQFAYPHSWDVIASPANPHPERMS